MVNSNLFIVIVCLLKWCLGDDSDKYLFPTLPVAPVKSTNELCRADSILFLENLNNLTLWAYKMYDATARSTTGTLQGNNYQLGDWDECRKSKAPFRTQFCLAEITANVSWLEPKKDPLALEMDPLGSVLWQILYANDVSQLPKDVAFTGWCVPASCTLNDLQIALDDHLNQSRIHLVKHNVSYVGKMQENMCQREGEGKQFDMLDGIFCVISAVFVFIVIIATVYEFKMENELTEKEKHNFQNNKGRRMLMAFSARKNFLDLTKPDESNPALRCLYGLRTFSIFTIIMGHRFGTFTSGPVLNFDDIERKYRTILGSAVFHDDLFVDTFFILSGLLVTYGLMVQFNKKYINPGFIIFLRYMRLTPLYAFVIFYYVTIFNYIGSGPLWKAIVYQESQDCKDNWWTNLLYVNNYVNDNHACMAQAWYLACDFHFFVIAIFLVLILLKNKKLGFALFIFCFILSIIVPFVITLIYERPGMVRFYPKTTRDPKGDPDFMLTYTKSHTRASAYCIGMIAGYIFYKLKDSEKRIPRVKSHAIVIVSILLLIISLPTGAVVYNPNHEYNAIEQAIYASLQRLPWSFGTVGIILTAGYGHSTFFQKILSWSPFIPLSRLVYAVYLIHLSLQFRALGITSSSATFDIFNMIALSFGDTVLSFTLGLILYLVIETPMRKLFRELFMGPRQPATSEPTFTHTSNGVNSISRRENDSRL